MLADFNKPPFCQFLATFGAANFGNFGSCQFWKLQELPFLATSGAANFGNFWSCQFWQLLELPILECSKYFNFSHWYLTNIPNSECIERCVKSPIVVLSFRFWQEKYT